MSNMTLYGPPQFISEIESDRDGAAAAGARMVRAPGEKTLAGDALLTTLAIIGYADNTIGVYSFIANNIRKWLKRRNIAGPLEFKILHDQALVSVTINPEWDAEKIVSHLRDKLGH
ncbi:hypothetical protein ACFPH6_33125 [Streptomyces xiangluensis]|uniref:Uncharacterized protein n=1 Tax=Streptomyces xiangluensis TaxID=2665720 RepID=A0ABV8YVN8_9ACTN